MFGSRDPGRPARPRAASLSPGPFVRQREKSDTREILGFIVRFGSIWTLLLLLIAFVPRLSEWAVAGTVVSLRLILSIVGMGGAFSGDSIVLGSVAFTIANDCTPLAATVGLWAAMLAFRASARWKLFGLVAGAAALWVYNLVRILALLPMMARRWSLFPVIHLYLWQTLTLAAVGAIFVTWHRWRPATGEPT